MWNHLAIGTIAGALALGAMSAQAQTINRKAVLAWTAPTACQGGSLLTNCPIKGYSIQRKIGTTWTEIGTTVANVLTFTEENLSIGTHTYRVLATSDAGPSSPSNEATKTIDVPGAPGNIVITITVTISP